MTNKTTKRALLSSVLALALCFTMLLGTTFAWFTDEVTSAGNVIKSGTLDVEMYYADGTKAVPADDSSDWKNAEGVAIYTAAQLWEPGYTDAKHIKISNEGTLALKYQLAIIPTGTVSKLAEVIDVYLYEIADTDANATQVENRTDLDASMLVGTLADVISQGIVRGNLAAGADYTTTVVLKMQESADDEYQNLSIGDDFTIQLLATQYTAESDSFGNDYDADAWVEGMQIYTAEDLAAAVANAEPGDVIALAEDIELTDSLVFTAAATAYAMRSTPASVVLDLAGKTLSSNGISPVVVNGCTLTIIDSGENGKIVNDGGFEAVALFNGATVFFESGVIESNGDGIYAYEAGNTIVVNGGTITVPTDEEGGHPAVAVQEGSTATLNGGILTGRYSLVSWDGTVSVTGGNLIGEFLGSDDTTVTGGIFSGHNYANPTEWLADGLKAVADQDGAYRVIPENSNLIYNAEQLAAALANGGEYLLTASISVAETTFTVPVGKTVVLNMNGMTIDGTFNVTANANKNLFDVKGNLTVNGEGLITVNTTGLNMGWNAMSCTLCVNGGDLTVNGTTVTNRGGTDMAYAIDTNPWNDKSNAVLDVVLNNAKVESTYRGIRVRDNGPYLAKLVATDSVIDEIWYQEYASGDNVNKGNYGILVEVVLNNTTADVSRIKEAGVLFIDGIEVVTTAEDLQNAINNATGDKTIVLYDGEYRGTIYMKSNVTLIGSEGTVVDCINLNGASNVTLKGITFDAAGAKMSYDGKGTAKTLGIANIITGDEIRSANRGAMNLVIDGCTFTGKLANGGAAIAFTDQGRTSGGSGNVTIKNCTFAAEGAYYGVYAHYTGNGSNGYGNFVIENNMFASAYAAGPIYLGRYASATPVELIGNTFATVDSLENAIYVQDHSSYGVSIQESGNTFAN